MFSFLTTFSGYLSKAFGRPTPEMHTLGMDNILLQMLNFEHHLETEKRVNVFIIGEKDSPKIQQAIEIVKKAGLEVDTSAPNVVNPYGKGYSFPQLFVVEIEKHSLSNFDELMEHLTTFAGRKETISLPAVFVKGNYYGGIKDLESHLEHGVLNEALKDHDYDLVVIGGGSGGLAAGKAAANADEAAGDVDKLRKIAVFDYVKPTPIGTTWGLGGTCVNVGCIPKKLMHQAALLGKSLYDARMFGWEFDEKCSINWSTLVANVHNHILGLNWGYKSKLREEKVTYYNAYASFVGSHKVKAVDKTGKEIIVTSDRFLIATGLRPRYLDIPGAKEFCITSDDLFTLPYPPGKTLIVGASYVALECAGFLHGFGFDVTVMVRSIFLRGFDQDMAERIGKHMEEMGVKFIKQTIPTSIEKLEDGKPGMYKVTAKSDSGEIVVGEYNTIMLAIGRDAITDDVGLEEVGILRNPKNKKVICHENEQSVTMPHVYAVGDVLDGKLELTPVAIQAGRFLADRLFRPSFLLCDYANVPTTIFTPLEYGCCGLSEEVAKEKYENSLMVYHSAFTPLEYTISKRKDSGHCYAKLICVDTDGSDNKLVVGLHILGPNAGEITQGFAMALKTGATVNDFKKLVGIHPTCAEVLTFASLVEKSEDPAGGGGC